MLRSILGCNFRLPIKLFGSANFIFSKVVNQQDKIKKQLNMHGNRHFDNPFNDFIPQKENEFIDIQTGKIDPKFAEQIKSFSDKLLDTLEKHLPSSRSDTSVYTGSAGIALLYFHLFEKSNNPAYLEKATHFIENSFTKTRHADISFLCGTAGPLAIAAVIFYKQNKPEKSKECITKLLNFFPVVANADSGVPDELLYGRVGYLFSMSFVNKYIPGAIEDDYFKTVINTVISSGQMLAHKDVPLMYEWHDSKYLGGAHGVAGIMYELLQCKKYMTAEQLQLVRRTIDFLLSIRYPSGNFPSSLGSKSDRLVHWCHGAPGTVQMLCAAYEAFGDRRYLNAAEACGDVVWERGLLKKGYGICHGVAGNAYTFLILYQLTSNLKYLYRACKFAEWCTTYNQFQERVPDRPYSLFEGLAGTIYFLNDMKDPLEAKFPCFTL